jgi:SET domain-containing protein
MQVSSYVSPKARKGQASSIDRRGMFAVDRIGRHEIVAVKGGHIMDSAALARLPEQLRETDIQIADDLFLAASDDPEYEPVMLFLNHSCEPNVGFAGNIVLIAMRDIDPGEEITTDYALFDDYDGQMECRCRTPSCRGVIRGRDWQLPELQGRYGSYFSWYLLNKMGGRQAPPTEPG